MNLQIVIALLTALGLGGLITAVVSHHLGKGKEIDFKKREQKERRYRSALLFMDVYLEPDNIRFFSTRQPPTPPIVSRQDVIENLKAEYHEMLLYSPKEVLVAVKRFILEPTHENFLTAILEMRADVWIGKHDLKIEEIKVNFPKDQ